MRIRQSFTQALTKGDIRPFIILTAGGMALGALIALLLPLVVFQIGALLFLLAAAALFGVGMGHSAASQFLVLNQAALPMTAVFFSGGWAFEAFTGRDHLVTALYVVLIFAAVAVEAFVQTKRRRTSC